MYSHGRGNDEKEYPFLVKGGEDLRLDQRIEQLFRIMNDIFARDAACCRRDLKLRFHSLMIFSFMQLCQLSKIGRTRLCQ
jgi:phosphatidylinositol kinase/protein kinase (PI-3  family)